MNEKLQILKMVQEGKVTVDEASKLLDAIEKPILDDLDSNNNKAKWLKIRIKDEDSSKVNVTLPISLINLGLKLGSKFSPELKASGLSEDELNEVFTAIKNGETGKIIDIQGENGETVEVTIE